MKDTIVLELLNSSWVYNGFIKLFIYKYVNIYKRRFRVLGEEQNGRVTEW